MRRSSPDRLVSDGAKVRTSSQGPPEPTAEQEIMTRPGRTALRGRAHLRAIAGEPVRARAPHRLRGRAHARGADARLRRSVERAPRLLRRAGRPRAPRANGPGGV